MFKKIIIYSLLFVEAIGCASTDRCWSSCNASSFGANWVVVQYDMTGKPINCWKPENVSMSNEGHSDGIYWLDTDTGNLIHLSGWYNYIQVSKKQYMEACRQLGINCSKCVGGKYQE